VPKALAVLSSGAILLISAWVRLDEAEAAAQKLLQDYPEVHDGFERLAMVYEARGDARLLSRQNQPAQKRQHQMIANHAFRWSAGGLHQNTRSRNTGSPIK